MRVAEKRGRGRVISCREALTAKQYTEKGDITMARFRTDGVVDVDAAR